MVKYDIFVSYSRHDLNTVDDFIKALQSAGYSVWYDKNGIESGDAFKEVIVSAIENSSVFLFFSSVYSNQSKWTAKEVGIANARNKIIIPIKLDNSPYNRAVEFDLINLDYIDFSQESLKIEGLKKLNRRLSDLLGSSFNINPFIFFKFDNKSQKGSLNKLFDFNFKSYIFPFDKSRVNILKKKILDNKKYWKYLLLALIVFVFIFSGSKSHSNKNNELATVKEAKLSAQTKSGNDKVITKKEKYTQKELQEASDYLYVNFTGILRKTDMLANPYLSKLYYALINYDEENLKEIYDYSQKS